MKPVYLSRMFYEMEFDRMRVTYTVGQYEEVLYICGRAWLNYKYNDLPQYVLEDRLISYMVECIRAERDYNLD